jgi:hypothetical protein
MTSQALVQSEWGFCVQMIPWDSSSRSLELLIGAFCIERDGRSLGLLLEY